MTFPNDPSSRAPSQIGQTCGRLAGACLLAVGLAFAATGPAHAISSGVEQGQAQADSLVRDLQDELRRLGFYAGPVDGILGPMTNQAISEVQLAAGWPVDGLPSRELLDHLYSQQDKAQALLDHLENNRVEQIDDAREMLAASEATQDLLSPVLGGPFLDSVAEENCANEPTTACLLDHAIAAAREMNDVERRSFAFLQIAEVQVAMGQVEAARQTLRRIRDPRYIISALDVLALGLSNQGRYDEALELIDVVPIVRIKIAGLDAVARAAHEAGEQTVVSRAVAEARETIEGDEGTAINPWRLIEFAQMLHAVDRSDEAQAMLERASAATLAVTEVESRDRITPQIVTTLLMVDRLETAQQLTAAIRTPDHRALAELALVRYLVDHGDYGSAHQVSAAIVPAEYRSLALAASASGLDGVAARTILAEALDAAGEIPFKRRRDEAYAVIAQGQAAIGDSDAALETAELIGDDALKAGTLFAMADDNAPLALAARRALDDVNQAYRRSLLQLHLAVELADAGDQNAADDSLDDAVASAFQVASDAERALALAHSAETLAAIHR